MEAHNARKKDRKGGRDDRPNKEDCCKEESMTDRRKKRCDEIA